MYGLMIACGLIAGISIAVIRADRSGLKKEDVLFASFFGCIGLLIGAKLLYILTNIPGLIIHWNQFIRKPAYYLPYLSDGYVFYGGLIGAVAALFFYCRKFHISYLGILDHMIPSIPVIHGFGRLGCFFAGCCYGIPYNGPGHIIFRHSFFAPKDISLFPTQVLEAAINFSAFIFLILYARSERKPGNVTGIYLLYYSVMRFLLEFLRGDIIRGSFLGLSTSQWISLALIPFGIYLISRYKTKDFKS
jgi:phosphatidylglycerol:prolipoprotein diacylglycerol transferase